jgi:sigma-B regulation protein RsbU (phosphoserine phosphatase)
VNSAIPIELLRADAPGVVLGVLIFFAGAIGCLLFALRPRPRDPALLYFGIAAGMYGLRLLASIGVVRQGFPVAGATWDWIIRVVNHTIFIPFTFFFTNTVAPQWKRLGPWIVAAAAGIAVFGLAARIVGAGAVGDKTYNLTVVLYLPLLALMLFVPRRPADRPLWVIRVGFLVAVASAVYTNLVQLQLFHGRSDLEPLGFLAFLCCQGYVAAERTFRNEQHLVAINKELQIARSIQFGLLPSQDVTVSGLEIATKYVPASSVAGDFYHFLMADKHGLGVLVADVSGHGVPAALLASMVKVAIHAQSERVRNPAEVLAGLNSILCGNLQEQFVTAAYVFIDVAQRQLCYSGAGHPPLLLWRAREEKVRIIEENGLVLGLFSGCEYKTLNCAFDVSDRLLLYTDGLVEAPNAVGEEFGSKRLQNFLASYALSPAAAFCDELMAQITKWHGSANGHSLPDDVTMVVIDLKSSAGLADLRGQSP